MVKIRKTVRTGIEKIQSLLDLIIKKAISMGAFSTPVNVTVLEKSGKSEGKVIIFAPGNSHS